MDHSASESFILTNNKTSSVSQIDLNESKLSYDDLLGLQVNSLRGGELKGHKSPINCVDVSCLSNLIASSDNTNKIRIWDLISRKSTLTITEDNLPINIYFIQSGLHLLVVLKTGIINIWDVLTSSLENTFQSQFNIITASAMIEGGFKFALAGENKIHIVKSNSFDIECEFNGHTDKITCLSFVPNSYLLVSGSADSTIRIWDIGGKFEICVLKGHEAEIKCLAISPDGGLIISFSTNFSMILWGLSSKTQIFKNSSNNFFINSMIFTENSENVIMACNEHSVKLWNVKKKHTDHSINQGQGTVKAIAVTPSCETIIAGYDDFKVRILSTQDNRCEETYYFGNFEPNCADISHDYNYLAVGGKDGNLTIWNMAKNELHKNVHFNEGKFYIMEITADNKTLIAGGHQGKINVYDIEKKKLIYSINPHTDSIWGLAISPNQKYILSAAEDKLVKVLRLSDGSEKTIFIGHTDCVNSVDSTSDSKFIISGAEDNLIKVWNFKSKEEAFTLNCESKVFYLKWYEAKKYIISGSRDYLIRLWDFNTRSVHAVLKGHTSTVRNFYISLNNQYLLSCGYDSMVFAWNLVEEKEMFSIECSLGYLRSVYLTSDYKYIIASGDTLIKMWTFEDQKLIFNAKVISRKPMHISFTRDDKYLISTGLDGCIRVLNFATMQEHSILHQMPTKINSLKFSSKLDFIVAGHENTSVCIYYIKTKKKRAMLIGHSNRINCLQLMSSDKYLISGSDDNTIKVWNILTRVCENTFSGHTASVISLAVTQDNSIIASGSADFSIRLWNFPKRILEYTLSSHSNIINSLVFSSCGRYLYSAYSYKSIVVWNITEKKEEFKLQGQLSHVTCLALSADKKHIISGNYKSILVWNIDSRNVEYELLGHFGLINFVGITPDLKNIYSVSQDCSAKRWSLVPKRMKNIVQRKVSIVNYLASNSSWAHFYTGTSDGYFKIYSSKTFELKDTFLLTKKSVKSVFVTDDESMGVCGCENGSAFIFKFGDITSFYKFSKQSKSVNMVCLSFDKTKLITAAESKIINLWDVKTKNLEKEFIGHRARVTHAIFLKNKNYIISSSEDWRIKVWNIETRIAEQTLLCNEVAYYVAINQGESLLAVATQNSEIHLFNLNFQSQLFLLKGHTNLVLRLAFSKSDTLVSCGYDGSAILWDVKQLNIIRRIKLNIYFYNRIGFVAENLIVATSFDNTVKIFDADTGNQIISPHNRSGNITTMMTLYNSNLLVNCSDSNTLNFYDVGKLLDYNTFFTSFIGKCICASDDEKYLYIGTSDGEIYEFDIEMQSHKLMMKAHSSLVCDICLMKGIDPLEPYLLVTASEDKTINVWDLENKILKSALHGHTRSVNELALVGKTNFIVSCSSDKTVRLWDIKEMKELFIFAGHTGAVLTVATTSDSIYAVSGSEDRSIRIWNLQTLRLDTIFTDHSSSVTSILACKSSEFIVSGDNEGNVIVWNLLDKRCEYKMPPFPLPIKKLSVTPSNDNIIVAYETKMCIVPIKSYSNNKTMIKKKYSSEDEMFDIEFSDGVISNIKSSSEDTQKTSLWEPSDNYDSVVQDLVSFYSVIDAVKFKTYSCSENAAKITFTKCKYTLAHIFAYYGQTSYLRNIMNYNFVLKTDVFGHSPIYYGIIKQYQTCVDAILDYLISNAGKTDILSYQSSIYALRNDFCLLIRNSSSILHLFLQNLLISSKSVFMKTSDRLPEFRFDNHSIPIYKDFLCNIGQENLVMLQYMPFSLPYVLGSNECIDFGEALVDCENNAIFSTPAIQNFIQYQWDNLYYWVAGNSILLFLNLIFLILVICFGNKELTLFIIFLCINVLLFLWESIQLFSSGLSYFGDIWNLMDTCRLITTFTYIILEFYEEDYPYLSWIMIMLNFVRGLTAFRMFDGTRFYVNLILRSIKAMLNFFIMFTYSTFTLSLLFIVSREQKSIDFNNLWMDSYALNFGGYEASSLNYPTLESIVFIIGTLINVVLMLNLLISILGDSYSEFQEEKYEIDFRLKAELTLEIQGMFFWVGSSNEKKVFQILSSPKEEENAENLDQKIKNLDKNLYSINTSQNDISEKMKSSLNIMTGKIDGIEGRVLALEDSINTSQKDISEKMKSSLDGIESRVSALEESINGNMLEILKILREKK